VFGGASVAMFAILARPQNCLPSPTGDYVANADLHEQGSLDLPALHSMPWQYIDEHCRAQCGSRCSCQKDGEQ
jgi:hypothetical protein